MSFGIGQHMVIIVRNNQHLRRRKKREKFRKSMNTWGIAYKPVLDFPKATPKLLKGIKRKLRRENQREFFLASLITLLICTTAVFLLIK